MTYLHKDETLGQSVDCQAYRTLGECVFCNRESASEFIRFSCEYLNRLEKLNPKASAIKAQLAHLDNAIHALKFPEVSL